MPIKKKVAMPSRFGTMSLRELVPYERNTKLHPMPQIKQLIRSISEFGFVAPIIIDEETKTIVAGHGRYQAAKQMGLDEVPVISVSHLTPAQIRAYNIADNQLTMNTGFDFELLQDELLALADAEMDMGAMGFTAKEIEEIMDGAWEDDEQDEETEEEEGERTRKEWIGNPLAWTTGEHIKFPSSNKYGIPDLDLDMQPTYIDTPVTIWGSVAKDKVWGTAICYSEDWRFEGLWDNPHAMLESHATMAVEPNFTVVSDMPYVAALWQIFRKRTIARYWQSQGLPVIVDLYVGSMYFKTNFIGVPKGWRAFATRAVDEDTLVQAYNLCCEHTGEKPKVFLVYGGGRKHAEMCARHGWTHQIEHMQIADQLIGKDYESEREVILDLIGKRGQDTKEERKPKKRRKKKRRKKEG